MPDTIVKFFSNGQNCRVVYAKKPFEDSIAFETYDDYKVIKIFHGNVTEEAKEIHPMIFPECRSKSFNWRELSKTGCDKSMIKGIIAAINNKIDNSNPHFDVITRITESTREIWQTDSANAMNIEEAIPDPIPSDDFRDQS